MTRPPTERQHRPDSLAWLSEELREEVRFVDEPDLKSRIYQWLEDVSKLPDGDAMDVVDHHLSEVRRKDGETEGMGEFAMRRLDGDGAEDFPDSCKGCEHYGSRCPVFVDPVERFRRDQLQEDHADSTPSQMRRAYRRYAEEIGCHQITQALSDAVEDHAELQRRGLALYQEADVDLGYVDEVDEAARIEAQAKQGGR